MGVTNARDNGVVSSPLEILQKTRNIYLDDTSLKQGLILHQIVQLATALKPHHPRESEALNEAYQHCITAPNFGGLGLDRDGQYNQDQIREACFLVSAYLDALNYQDRKASPPKPLTERPSGRRGMNVAEKILAAHDVSRKGEVKPGDVLRIDVDWVIASELNWAPMEKAYESFGRPGIFRNDRFWLAGDHAVDPRIMDTPRIKPLVDASERARQVFKLTEYQGMNHTILHTEFARERAEPGMLVIGSDSHTCSSGSVSCLAIGLGVADTCLPLVTGETWIKVPETVRINFINRPKPGIGGKDIILYILKVLKRNTVAAERIVEYTGPGLQYLSVDARFAFCNMTAEFGGVTGICVPDETTRDYVDKRKNPKYRRNAVYYQPDPDAVYAETFDIDLDKVESFVARYPSPDDVVPVAKVAGTALDGCFIGACTTAHEDLVIAALVLEAGLKRGWKPTSKGTRKVVPGSRPILHELREQGLADIYEKCGFEIGVPGCSYCVGISADRGQKGEVWLSSQNRNFENRMGPGAIGSIASAATVAASSFGMAITDPTELLDKIDHDRLHEILGKAPEVRAPMQYMHPAAPYHLDESATPGDPSMPATSAKTGAVVTGKVQTLGDYIDTDAISPSDCLVGTPTIEEMGQWCLKYTHPDFRRRVKEEGLNIVVAGKAFGVGSSRETAVTALLGAGVKCVIARSYSFIYARNQPALGLLGIIMNDDEFYRLAKDTEAISIDVDARKISLGGKDFSFSLSELEIKLWQVGGMTHAFKAWGNGILEKLTGGSKPTKKQSSFQHSGEEAMMQW